MPEKSCSFPIDLFGLLYLIGGTRVLADLKIRNNGYLVLSSLGTVVMLLVLGFDWFWSDILGETEQKIYIIHLNL
jgi:hypothetical protein